MLLTKKVLWYFRHGIEYQIRSIACKKGYSEHNVSRVLIEKARSLSSEYLQFHQVNNKVSVGKQSVKSACYCSRYNNNGNTSIPDIKLYS